MHLLIPYVPIRHHLDPTLAEFTYGDSDSRARKLKSGLHKGDYVFFHTTLGGRKCITAYYVVDRVLDTTVASSDRAIADKYRNPHLVECIEGKRPVAGRDDVVLFGDPITSRVLNRPLAFDRALASQLSLDIKFPLGRRENQTISSATRAWRTLADKDVELIRAAINSCEADVHPDVPRSTEEVAETLEKDVEDYLAINPHLIGPGLKLVARQLPVESGRIDLLFETSQGDLVVVEVKLGRVGREAMRQVQDYMHDLRRTEHPKKVAGVLVCAGVMPAFEEELRRQTKVRILVYGWKMEVQSW